MNVDDARRALRILTAAFPTYPVNDDTAELYLAVMVDKMPDSAAVFAVVADWTVQQLFFPKPAELLDAYLEEQRKRASRTKAIQAGQKHQQPGYVSCRDCGDTKWITYDTEDGHVETHWCPTCEPERYRYQMQGHLDSNHDRRACEHPWCQRAAQKRKSA